MRIWRRTVSRASERPRASRARLSIEGLESRCLLDAGYAVTNLVSDIGGLAIHTDKDLVNPWGFAITPTGQFRVSGNGVGESILLTASGIALGAPVIVPPPPGSPPGTVAAPDGSALNTTSGFVISEDGRTAPATFLISTEDGTIAAFNPAVDKRHALIVADLSGSGAVFKTLTLASNGQGPVIFASDFHNDRVDMFDQKFNLVGSFTDPNPHAGFAPFGVHNLNGTIFVTFAKQDDPNNAHDDVEGAGNGFIDEFTTSGTFIKRFATGSALQPGGLDVLNSPFGAAVAPAGFGQFGSTPNNPVLLIGNFGSSQISAFNLTTGAFLGQLSDARGHPLVLNGGIKETDLKGLWAIRFGNGQGGADANTLFFSAGINAEGDGLFGTVTAVSTPSTPRSNDLVSLANALHATTSPASTSRPGAESGPSLSHSQESALLAAMAHDGLAPTASTSGSSRQSDAPAAGLNSIARSERDNLLDQLFSALFD
jgi:uncharacterized protein (TIGR03118 family)